MKKKLAIITTHPIQYNAPLFKLLQVSNSIIPKVFYTWSQSEKGAIYDPGFGKKIEWDIPLLEGYDYTFVKNTSNTPGTHHFKGIKNPTLNAEIEKWNPDLLLIYGWSFKSHLNCIQYFHKKVPIIFRGDSTLIGEKWGLKMLLRTAFLSWVYRHIDYALYVGSNNKKYYLRQGLKEQQLIFAPHAIDNERFSRDKDLYATEALSWRKKIGILNNDIVFLFAGKLEINKNAVLLIEAFKKINKADIHLVIVGNGVMEKKLKEKYTSLKNLHFINFQNQSRMPVVYHLGDIFVLPSKGPVETWGLAINEAMACSRAVIASDRCGAAIDLIQNNKNGFVFKNENKNDLFKKMELIISNRDQLASMKEKSNQIIKEWTFEKISNKIEKVITSKFI